jgi:hypothetical protein
MLVISLFGYTWNENEEKGKWINNNDGSAAIITNWLFAGKFPVKSLNEIFVKCLWFSKKSNLMIFAARGGLIDYLGHYCLE